jgi:mRNA interferase YafQ
MYEIFRTTSFKRNFKLVKKRGCDLGKLKQIISKLQKNESLLSKNRDHQLTGGWKGYRECHITPDWLLIYRIKDEVLELVRTGSHTDLFDM